MKKNSSLKKFLILALIFLFVLSIGSSFATDDTNIAGDTIASENNDVVVSIDSVDNSGNAVEDMIAGDSSNATEPAYASDDSNESESENSINVNYEKSSITVNGGTFKDIQEAIDLASDNYTIYLTSDFYGDGSLIIVNKSVVIEGRPMITLDANYTSRAFAILSDNVILKNLKIIHAYDDPGFIDPNIPSSIEKKIHYWDKGAAIVWFGNNGTLINSVIVDNKIVFGTYADNGKAISWMGRNGRIINSYFGFNSYDMNVLYTNGSGRITSYYISDNIDCPIHGLYYGKLDSNVFFPDITVNTLPELSIGNITSYYGEGKKISFNINHDNVSFVNETLNVSIISKKDSYVFNVTCDEKGNVNFNLPKNLSAGNYSLIVNFSEYKSDNIALLASTLNTISSITTLTINKAHIEVTAPKYNVQYDSGAKYNIKLINSKTKKPLTGMKVTLKVYTGKTFKTYTAYADKKGIASFKNLSTSNVGKHKVSISIDKNYNLNKKEFTIQVSKAKTDVKISKTSFKYKKSDYLKISLKNNVTKASVKNLQVKVKIFTGKKSKTYNLKTDKNGMVKINTKGLSKGSHKIQISSNSKLYLLSKTTSIKVK
ncbi:MAG: hypothetical protein IKV87_08580 [Methanobrevibacter sp.]|nr:hypothetical protein [Methanobrevibacter sp.]